MAALASHFGGGAPERTLGRRGYCRTLDALSVTPSARQLSQRESQGFTTPKGFPFGRYHPAGLHLVGRIRTVLIRHGLCRATSPEGKAFSLPFQFPASEKGRRLAAPFGIISAFPPRNRPRWRGRCPPWWGPCRRPWRNQACRRRCRRSSSTPASPDRQP